MKRLIILFLLTPMMAPAPANAQGDGRAEALAGQLIEAARFDDVVDQFLDGTQNVLIDAAKQAAAEGRTGRTEEQIAEFETILKEELDLSKQDMMAPMKDLMVRFYTDNFSEEEISELIDLYSSPVFQKVYDKTPELTQQAIRLALSLQQKSQKRFQQRLDAWKSKYGID